MGGNVMRFLCTLAACALRISAIVLQTGLPVVLGVVLLTGVPDILEDPAGANLVGLGLVPLVPPLLPAVG